MKLTREGRVEWSHLPRPRLVSLMSEVDVFFHFRSFVGDVLGMTPISIKIYKQCPTNGQDRGDAV